LLALAGDRIGELARLLPDDFVDLGGEALLFLLFGGGSGPKALWSGVDARRLPRLLAFPWGEPRSVRQRIDALGEDCQSLAYE
jgi:hypothetical protein